jgi:sodium/potassium-transporting ATPase subunit alpha
LTLSSAEVEGRKPEDLLLTIKGAPDIIFERCSKYMDEERYLHALDATMKATIEEIKINWSSERKRVLFRAKKVL